ncbi:hypothetical protein IMG5_020760 [Ichthyophthirius multifiliis]|uniref:SURF1-like protein n=1 Tax=Ichthyophthirius multifiliis TaxID=5932 RepID=G0QKQ8_ICHMU|nr:hypothetical protein IMG5_020760 [Ichthyophthirius multifiliis]EGR34212.1 hypothetical protein IMG5_020760 [Ichthyophthirius multifiliis]|eukprot:XP_004039516.1 hypothetical protein IMG5_020760 [Ichthyophthirius multifiliis]
MKNEVELPITKTNDPNSLFLRTQASRFWNRIGHTGRAFPKRSLYLGIFGVFSLSMGFLTKLESKRNHKKVEQMKEQMALPQLEIKEAKQLFDENTRPNSLYRTIKIKGRPIHRKGMMIPVKSYGLYGYEYLVPLVTFENEDESHQEGFILNLGFIPQEYAEISQRCKIENVEIQEFTCVVNDSQHLQKQGGIFAKNDLEKNKWEYANLKQLTQFTEFKNQEQCQSFILEQVNPNTELNEKNCQHLNINSDYREDYPYIFTRSGILQQGDRMYWNLNKYSNNYLYMGCTSLLISALFTLAK